MRPVILNFVFPQHIPPGRGINRDHGFGQPEFGFISQLQYAQVGSGLNNGINTRSIDFLIGAMTPFSILSFLNQPRQAHRTTFAASAQRQNAFRREVTMMLCREQFPQPETKFNHHCHIALA
jgi:hypothetical protein